MDFLIPSVIQGLKFCFLTYLLNFLRGIYLSNNLFIGKSKLLNLILGTFSDRLSTDLQLILVFVNAYHDNQIITKLSVSVNGII